MHVDESVLSQLTRLLRAEHNDFFTGTPDLTCELFLF